MDNPIQLYGKTFIPYISEKEIDEIITTIANQLNNDFSGKHPLFIGVLNGSFMFVSDLMKKMEIDVELSFVKFESYFGMASSGKVSELIGLTADLNKRHVVILEDIVDTGNTIGELLDLLGSEAPASLSIATLLLKPDVFNKKYNVQYVGKNIPNKFVVGFGLDYNESGRNLKSIYQVVEE